jgi:flagellar motor switch protein FliG
MHRIILISILIAVSEFLNSQEEVLSNKAQYENFLANKVENAITKILGPSQVKVLVDITMDYSKIEKVEYEKINKVKENFIAAKEAGDISGKDYLMPGFEIPKVESSANEPRSYTKQLIIPSNLIKKIKVNLIVNEKLDESIVKNITSMTREILNLDEKRGDEIVVLKSFFAPMWKTIWYDPSSLNFIMKYIIISIVGIISLLIVAMGFLKLASAMNTMAKVQQTHQITMEVGGGGLQGPAGIGLDITRPLLESKEKAVSEQTPEESSLSEKIYFDIKPYQIDALVNLMIKEDPSNVAIIVDHLRDDIKAEFLKRLPEGFASDIILSLAQMRFVDRDTIMQIKEELETRLSGAVGGVNTALKLIENLSWIEKSRYLKNIESKRPEIYREIRRHFVLLEDLKYLDDKDMSILISQTSIDDWANVFGIIDDEFKERLKGEFSQTALKIIEEKSKDVITNEKIEKSISNIMTVVDNLIKEGRIKKPQIDFNLLEKR